MGKKGSNSMGNEQKLCEVFDNKERNWTAATKENIKASKRQYTRHPVGINAELYRKNGGYRKKQQAKEIGMLRIPPNKPIPRAKDQWDIKRKFEEMRGRSKGVESTRKFFREEHRARARRLGDLQEDEDVRELGEVNELGNITVDDGGVQGDLGSSNKVFICDVELIEENNEKVIVFDDKETHDSDNIGKDITGGLCNTSSSKSSKPDNLGYDFGVDFIG